MKKIKISMVKYNEKGEPLDVVYGEYKSQDVEILREYGYVDVNEGLAKKLKSILWNR